MNYRLDNKKKQQRQGWFAALLLLLLLVLTPATRSFFRVFEVPLEKLWSASGELDSPNPTEYERMRVDLLRLDYLESELDLLLDLKTTYPEAKLAQVIKRNGQHEIILNKGALDGLTSGDFVFAEDHFLFAQLSWVGDHLARAELFSKPGTSIPVVIHDQSLLIEGAGGPQYMIRAPRELELEEGDVVYSQAYPGAVIGVVAQVHFDPRDPFKHVFIRMSYNPRNLQTVALRPGRYE